MSENSGEFLSPNHRDIMHPFLRQIEESGITIQQPENSPLNFHGYLAFFIDTFRIDQEPNTNHVNAHIENLNQFIEIIKNPTETINFVQAINQAIENTILILRNNPKIGKNATRYKNLIYARYNLINKGLGLTPLNNLVENKQLNLQVNAQRASKMISYAQKTMLEYANSKELGIFGFTGYKTPPKNHI